MIEGEKNILKKNIHVLLLKFLMNANEDFEEFHINL